MLSVSVQGKLRETDICRVISNTDIFNGDGSAMAGLFRVPIPAFQVMVWKCMYLSGNMTKGPVLQGTPLIGLENCPE